MRKLLALVVVALGLGAAGGWVLFERTDEDDDEAATADWNTCTNSLLGFSIDYPAGWYTDHPVPDAACFYFDPRRFDVPRASDFTGTALQVQRGNSFSETVDGYTDPMFWTVRSRRDTEVDGRRAVRFESEATGEGLLGPGAVVYGYVLDWDRNALAVLTHSSVGIDYAPWKRVVDRAVETLRPIPRAREPVLGADVLPPQFGLPEPVARKRAEIWEAARERDYAALGRLVDPKGFEYTFGGPVPGGPTAYWRQLERSERPLDILVAILQLPFVHDEQSKLYVWPFAFTRKASSLTPEEKEQLALAIGDVQMRFYEQSDNYLGYRAGIDEGGDWVFYVAGD